MARMKAMASVLQVVKEAQVFDHFGPAIVASPCLPAEESQRLRSVVDLATACGYPERHSNQTAFLAERIFQQTVSLHRLGEKEAQLLYYGALLHDIGYCLGYSRHHKYGYFLVVNGHLRGFTHEELHIIANIVRYHRRSWPKESHRAFALLPPKSREVVRSLSAILRVADGLDRSRSALITDVRCIFLKTRKIRFEIATTERHRKIRADLRAAKRRGRYFEKLFDIKTAITTRQCLPMKPSNASDSMPRLFRLSYRKGVAGLLEDWQKNTDGA